MMSKLMPFARLCTPVLAAAALSAALPAGAAQAATPRQVGSFIHAVELDDEDTVRTLLAAGVSPNTAKPAGGEPGLVLAVREGSRRAFAVLMADPAIQVEQESQNHTTALMMAAFKRDKPAVLALLAKGARVNRPGWSALHYAAASGDDEIVRILLGHQAAIDGRSPDQLTPLMLAVREGHESTAQLLMEEGADATLTGGDGFSAAGIAERTDKPRIAAAIALHLKKR